MTMPKLFLDLETTGLDPKRHEILEVGGVLREEGYDAVVHFSLDIDEALADPEALKINRYHERIGELAPIRMGADEARETLRNVTSDVLIIGNNVGFDLAFLREFLGSSPWYYQPLDLKAYAAGMVGKTIPVTTKFLAELAEVPLPGDQHTAVADAMWNRDVYDALTGRIEY